MTTRRDFLQRAVAAAALSGVPTRMWGAAEACCVFARSEIGAAPVRFVVRPANCWRKTGRPLSVMFEG